MIRFMIDAVFRPKKLGTDRPLVTILCRRFTVYLAFNTVKQQVSVG